MSAPNIFDSSAPAHLGGVRGTETAHRKIELQAPEDLTFLVAKLSEAARERIEKEFSTAAAAAAAATEQGKDGGIGVDINGEDQAALRRRVEELVDEVSADDACRCCFWGEELGREGKKRQEMKER
jgi:kinetochor protein Mis14/NSL1